MSKQTTAWRFATAVLVVQALGSSKGLDGLDLLVDPEGGCGGLVVESSFGGSEVVWGKED
jgi:hypothetical protein